MKLTIFFTILLSLTCYCLSQWDKKEEKIVRNAYKYLESDFLSPYFLVAGTKSQSSHFCVDDLAKKKQKHLDIVTLRKYQKYVTIGKDGYDNGGHDERINKIMEL